MTGGEKKFKIGQNAANPGLFFIHPVVNYYIKWVTTSWTYCTFAKKTLHTIKQTNTHSYRRKKCTKFTKLKTGGRHTHTRNCVSKFVPFFASEI